MARPKSENKRIAIMEAAIRVIVRQGLNAPTALIAKESGFANGTLFIYFETKAELFNALYLELKVGMASAALEGFPVASDLRQQAFHVWSNWMDWAVSNPEKRRVLAQLFVSEEITPATHAAAQRAMGPLAALLERMRAHGSLSDVSMEYAITLMNSMAEATMDFMLHDPTNAQKHCRVGFEALWRVIE